MSEAINFLILIFALYLCGRLSLYFRNYLGLFRLKGIRCAAYCHMFQKKVLCVCLERVIIYTVSGEMLMGNVDEEYMWSFCNIHATFL